MENPVNPRKLLPLLLAALPLPALAEACLVHAVRAGTEVQICQQNVSIPPAMFHDSFCQPQLQDQEVRVEFMEQCPTGDFGRCVGAQVPGVPYRQDIHYYGVASDARILRPYCEHNSGGQWQESPPASH